MRYDRRRSLLAVGVVLAITGLFTWWTLAEGGDAVDREIGPAGVAPATADRGPTTSVLVERAADVPTTTPTTTPTTSPTTTPTTTPVTAAAGQTVTPTDSKVSLPAIGDTTSEWTQELGPLWIVHHDDGTVTVLPGVVMRQATADTFDFDGLASLVWWSSSGRSFAVGEDLFDEWGRAVDGERSNGLQPYSASVGESVVSVSMTSIAHVDGDPRPVSPQADLYAPMLPDPVDVATARETPGWFVLDTWLVVVGGVGVLCDVEVVGECGAGAGHITSIACADCEQTMLPAPLIVHVDAAGSVDTAASLVGVFPTTEPTIVEAGPSCGATDEATVRVRFSAPRPIDVIVEVRQGDTLIGTATASLTDDLPWKTVQVPVTVYVDADDPLAEIVIRSADPPDEQLAVGTVDFRLDRRDFGCPF